MFKINFYQKYVLVLLILVIDLYPSRASACSEINSDSGSVNNILRNIIYQL